MAEEPNNDELEEYKRQAGLEDPIDVSHLKQEDIWSLQASYYDAMYEEHGSGAHWILISALGRLGFRTSTTGQAMKVAERVIQKWHNTNQGKLSE